MFQADILLTDAAARQFSGTLVWMADLDLLIQANTAWSIDQRLDFRMTMDALTASGVVEVRAWRTINNMWLARCRIVRITPDNATRLRSWQIHLKTTDATMFDAPSEETSISVRRGRDALTDALKSRVRRIKAERSARS